MRINCSNTWAYVEDATPDETSLLYRFLSIEQPGAKHSPAFKRGHWDGKVHLYSRRHDRFPTGLLRMTAAELQRLNIDVAIKDQRGGPPVPWVEGVAPFLFDYQADAVAACGRRTRGIVAAPTGSGKGEVAVAVALSVPQARCLVVVDSRDLMEMMAKRYEKYSGEKAGRIGDGLWDVRRYTAATYQSLYAHIKEPKFQELVDQVQCLMVDEAHALPADTFYDTIMRFENAYWRLGLSATPMMRRDAQELRMVAALGLVVHKIDPLDLIAQGRMAQPYIRFIEHKHGPIKGTFPHVYDHAVVANDERNGKLVDLAVQLSDRPTLMFVRALAHGRVLTHMLEQRGVAAKFVQGKTVDRMAAVEQLLRRDLQVIVCSSVFNKGIDIPEAAVGINAAAGDSPVDAIQRLGRITRGPHLCPGKTTCEYWDVRDKGQKWLAAHAKGRMDVYREYGFPPEIVYEVPEALQQALV